MVKCNRRLCREELPLRPSLKLKLCFALRCSLRQCSATSQIRVWLLFSFATHDSIIIDARLTICGGTAAVTLALQGAPLRGTAGRRRAAVGRPTTTGGEETGRRTDTDEGLQVATLSFYFQLTFKQDLWAVQNFLWVILIFWVNRLIVFSFTPSSTHC